MATVGRVKLRTTASAFAGAARRTRAAGHPLAVATILLALIGAAETFAWAAGQSRISTGYSRELAAALTLLSLLTTAPLVLASTQPAGAALVVTTACVLSLVLLHMLPFASLAVLLIALFQLGRAGSPQLLAAALAMPFLPVALLSQPGQQPHLRAVLVALLAPVAAWSGIALRARHESARHSDAQRVIAGSLLEHTARGERARICHELHDVVAHHISMIAVQAETARLTTPGLPAAGAQRLLSIGDLARTALTEMRRLLGVLREDASADVAELRPQPSLGLLNELLDEARATSEASTRLLVSGSPVALDPGVELAGYRIIQEALTNSRRHAPGAAVDVELHYRPDELLLRVRDNGPGPDSGTPASGHGLLGMRERAAAVGGSLRTGVASSGGYLIEATLPALLTARPGSAASPAVGARSAG